ncbi:hypothetical protein, conserved [Entamoeba dispar SAW760]|uniref:Protein kinase domain-containing protein n=1 Tax=Entamoeba dispar (strain ATCC PRA-260 / SAW760) TaxID=370354 RepID=B0ENK2_ENTDS|nr:uncharacterized protein EDI_217880 [Entamoeba dispar SAW760]EDR23883.1 hypothetical protein, conserved [Entamoeba dispar SAW760]|eukprot:EDR23883.1 hypothetical protein, conserved [Entamoeba dispar SAW760]
MSKRLLKRVVQTEVFQSYGIQEGIILDNETNKYRISKVIGYGAFGIVFLANNIKTGEINAIKRVSQGKRSKNKELRIQEMLHHQNVIKLKDSFLSKLSNSSSFCLNIVMDYLPQNLYQFMRSLKKKVPIIYIRLFSYELIRGLAYIHSLNIIHQDIKPENILVNKNTGDLKICDFGSAKNILDSSEPNVSYICSRHYRAPELVFRTNKYNSSIDIWSYGCILAEMFLGKPLFPGSSTSDQVIKIIKIIGTPTEEEMKAMNNEIPPPILPKVDGIGIENTLRSFKPPSQAIQILTHTLQYSPEKRLSASRLVTSEFHKELFSEGVLLPNGNPIPLLTQYDENEWKRGKENETIDKMKEFVEGEKKRVLSQHLIRKDNETKDTISDAK